MWQIWEDFFPNKSFCRSYRPLYFNLLYLILIFGHQLAKYCQLKKEKKKSLQRHVPKKKGHY
jgi:hypothetical protein